MILMQRYQLKLTLSLKHNCKIVMSDNELITLCIRNNAQGQQELYEKYSPKMLGVCYRYARNKEDAEDMLQESFIKIFTCLHQYRGEGPLEAWMRRIVVHCCIGNLKKYKNFLNSLTVEAATAIPNTNENIGSMLMAKQIIECIRLLPLGYRTVLNLYAIEGLSHKEIGEILNIGESTSRSQYTRAKNMLQQVLIKNKIVETETKDDNYFERLLILP
jgi:RNA polymerase sigma factor (sigma-70 family)